MKKLGLVIFAIMLWAVPSYAWNCTGNDIRVQVPTGTVGTGTGDAPGNVVVDNGLTFQCQTPTPAPTTGNTNTNTNSSTSGSTSGSTSNSTATGGNATATGGNSTSNQTQGQKQGQSQSSNNQSAGGSVSNVGNSVENITAPKIPVASAYAPTTIPSAPCVKGFGAGIQTMPVGGSLGGSKVDAGCDIREDARSFFLAGSRLAGCKMLVSSKRAQKAGVTLQDCLTPIVAAPAPIVQPVVPPAPQVTVVQAPPTFVYLSAPPIASAPPAATVIPVKPTPAKHTARKIGQPKPCYVIQDQCVVVGHAEGK